ncbi:MAG: hypothetical protein IJU41_06675, partial [Clostridia bacterium]|nr:hypothetical protein [Clostridia bacterium]
CSQSRASAVQRSSPSALIFSPKTLAFSKRLPIKAKLTGKSRKRGAAVQVLYIYKFERKKRCVNPQPTI